MKYLLQGVKTISAPEYGADVMLSIAILVFGFLTMLIVAILAYRKNQGWGTNTVRIFGVIFIVTAALFLITAGYSEKQIAPVLALLGTIVGYFLGSGSVSGGGQKSSSTGGG